MSRTRRSNERLLRALLRREDPWPELATRRDEAAWQDLLALLRRHRLMGFAGRALSAWPERLPEEAQARIHQARVSSSLLNAAVARDAALILPAFEAAGVPAVPLKGPWLAEHMGAGFDERPTCDLDVLVPVSAMGRAASALADLGCTASPDKGAVRLPRHTTFAPSDGGLWTARVEVHCRLIDDDGSPWMGRLWNRADRCRWRDLDTWVMSPADLVLMLAVHAYLHGWAHLCQVLDLSMAVGAERGRLDWDLVVDQAREAGIASAAGRSLALASSLCAADVPPEVLRSLRRAPIRRLAANALLRRRGGVVRPRSPLLTGPYSSLLTMLCDDDPGRRGLDARRACRRPDGRRGRYAWPALGPLARVAHLALQAVAGVSR